MRHRVQADDVGGAVGRALRPADRGAGQRVDLVVAQSQRIAVTHRREHREDADAVGDEVGRVLRTNHALAQRGGEPGLQRIEQIAVGVRGRDQLDQVHVARRIEEVDAAESRPQRGGQCQGELRERQSRGVRHQCGGRPDVRRDFRVQVALPVDALGDRLDHQVATGESRQVGVVVRRVDLRREVACAKRRRLELRQCIARRAARARCGSAGRARSNSSAGTPAFARCAAICAPMTPAPRTAARRTRNGQDGLVEDIGEGT